MTTRVSANNWRILFHVGVDPDSDEGHGVHVRRLTEALERRGHRVWVVGTSVHGRQSWDRSGPELTRVSLSSVPKLGWVLTQIRGSRVLEDLVRRVEPDLLLARSDVLSFAPLIARVRLPLVVESNASVAGHLRGRSGPRAALARSVERRLLERAAVVGCVTPELIECHRENHGLDGARFGVVPNGAPVPPSLDPVARRQLREAGGVGPDDFLVAYAGTASRHVEFRWVLQAVESVPQSRLWVIGDGPDANHWRGWGERSPARDRVRFLGPLPEAEAARRLQAAECVVAPYRQEVLSAIAGDPMKVVFGMACGRFVLASGVFRDPPLEKIGAGQVVPSDPAAWRRSLEELVRRWKEDGSPAADWPWSGPSPGPEWVRNHRTWDHTAACWEKLISRVTND